jgi:hypothetical protein
MGGLDDEGIIRSANEAEANISSMQHYLSICICRGLAPYMVADEEYQQKRYGPGKLVNQACRRVMK